MSVIGHHSHQNYPVKITTFSRGNIRFFFIEQIKFSKMIYFGQFLCFLLFALLFPKITPEELQFGHKVILDLTTDTTLKWERNTSTITFTFSTLVSKMEPGNVILLGLSKTGQVAGSDVVAVDVEHNSVVDMHGVDNSTLFPDRVQNWNLISIRQDSSHLVFTISRDLITCNDEQDVVINNDLLRVIWGYSKPSIENGSVQFAPEGSFREYLLAPKVPTPDKDAEIWRVSRKFRLPARSTTYWCTIHRGLPLQKKHHIVGYAPYFKDEISRQHVHHLVIHRCITRTGVEPKELFEKFVDHPGEECYHEDNHQLPTVFCSEIVLSWDVGGEPFYFPEDIGLALGDSQGTEYFMMETHYDNPDSRADLVIDNGLDILYSSQLRKKEGSIMLIGYGPPGLFHLPPQAKSFKVAGHCSSSCTSGMFPPSGVEIVAAKLHGHMTSRQITVKVYRGNRELPWLEHDSNYDFKYQQFRLLPERISLIPGDHLTVECVMDTSSRNTSTLAGYSTRDEMCVSMIMLTKRLPYTFCTSEYPTDHTMAKYGITNMTWNREKSERVVRAARNPKFVGLPLRSVLDQMKWTDQRIRELEREQLYEWHDSACPQIKDTMSLAHTLISIDEMTRGLIPTGKIVESMRPSTRSISTPIFPGLRRTRYPTRKRKYTPAQTCQVGKEQ